MQILTQKFDVFPVEIISQYVAVCNSHMQVPNTFAVVSNKTFSVSLILYSKKDTQASRYLRPHAAPWILLICTYLQRWSGFVSFLQSLREESNSASVLLSVVIWAIYSRIAFFGPYFKLRKWVSTILVRTIQLFISNITELSVVLYVSRETILSHDWDKKKSWGWWCGLHRLAWFKANTAVRRVPKVSINYAKYLTANQS
jgi:hypothetical protein